MKANRWEKIQHANRRHEKMVEWLFKYVIKWLARQMIILEVKRDIS